ncbi:MAG: DUF3267 domain-containing protein [Oscillospiraceae bacterium]|nr:DUF3267 domain-containing protein [Oscillospiraceae bacterium]
MRAYNTLPDDYSEIFSVDLQKDKKMMILINVIAVLIAVVLAVPMHFHISIVTLFDMSHGLGAYAVRFIALLVLIIVYMVLHELVHGIAMKLCGTKKVRYGFTGMYAFAGSDDCYDKKSYIFVALAPVVLWGVVIAIVNAVIPAEWFWVLYIIQITNLSGAAGDLYVTFKFSKFPKDILVRDSGVSMRVYSKEDI